MPQRTKPGVDWAEIERRVRAGESSTSIAKDLGENGVVEIKRQSIDKRAKKEGWNDEAHKADGLDEEKIDWLALALQTETAKIHDDPQTRGEKNMVTMGRRSPENMAKILEMVNQGASPNLAIQACGCSEGLMTKWRTEDPSFAELIRVARGMFLSGQQVNIAKSGHRGDWKASQAILQASPETRKEWASNGPSGTGITVNISIGGEDSPPIVDITPTDEDK